MIKVDKRLMRCCGRAVARFDMIRPGDRLLLGVSGGKDSLTLLHILCQLQRHAPIDFELGAVTVDPLIDGFDPSGLITYLKTVGVPHHYQREPIAARAHQHMIGDSFCSWCARMKRGVMYATARQKGYNVLVLAQHLDDLAESFLMSAFHGGRLRTMKAHYRVKDGDLRVIRPLVYAREWQTRGFAQRAGVPVIPDSCPACFARPAERERMKELLNAEEKHNPALFKRLLSTLSPLMAVNTAE